MNYEGATRLIHALDSPVRMQILHLLENESRCVHELVKIVSSSQPLVSQHLKVLKSAELVTAERRGREVFYSLVNNDVIHLLNVAIEQANRKTVV